MTMPSPCLEVIFQSSMPEEQLECWTIHITATIAQQRWVADIFDQQGDHDGRRTSRKRQ